MTWDVFPKSKLIIENIGCKGLHDQLGLMMLLGKLFWENFLVHYSFFKSVKRNKHRMIKMIEHTQSFYSLITFTEMLILLNISKMSCTTIIMQSWISMKRPPAFETPLTPQCCN